MQSMLMSVFGFILVVSLSVLNGHANHSNSRCTHPEFRVDTSVYVGDEKQPSSQNTTLFSNEMVVDFSMTGQDQDPSEITIYDSSSDTFSVLDPQREVKFVMRRSQLITIVEGLRAETYQNPATRFLAAANYREEQDLSTGWFALKNDAISYRFKGKRPKDVQLVAVYHTFLDNYTLLAATDPQRLPPFPRLHLNRVIRKLGLIPTEINLSVQETQLLQRPLSFTSKHTLVERLSDSDRARIESACQKRSRYQTVNMAAYRGLALSDAAESSSDRRP